jgi:hypothetical protein
MRLRRGGMLLVALAGATRAGHLSGQPPFKVSPSIVEIGAFYSGTTVRVAGIAANGAKVIITVSGPELEERFNTKGRSGPIWLNSGKVRVHGVPSMLLRFSCAPVEQLLPKEAARCRRLNQSSLAGQMRIDPPAVDSPDNLKSHFLALKSEAGLYQFRDDGVALDKPGKDGTPYSLEFRWPRRAPPATYEIAVYEVRDGTVVEEASMPLRVVRTGFPEWLARISGQHAALYGAAAVIIGALAGFGIDLLTMLLFGKKRTVSH